MKDELEARMREAWTTRRSSFDAHPGRARELLDRARAELAETVELARRADLPALLAQALHLQANVELDLEREERARQLWEEAIALLRHAGEPLQLAHKIRHLGDLERRQGQLLLAEQAYAEALELHRRHDIPASLDFANAAQRMASLQEKLGRPTRALALWRETRELYAAVGLDQGVEGAARHVARLEGAARET